MKIGKVLGFEGVGPAGMKKAAESRDTAAEAKLGRLRELVESANNTSFVTHASGGVKKRAVDLVYWELIMKELGVNS